MSLNISCQNIYKTVRNLLGKDWKTVQTLLNQTCQNPDDLEKICNIIGLDKNLNPYEGIIQQLCPSLIKQCTPTLCDPTKVSSLVVSCDNLKKIMNTLFKNETSFPNFEEQEICDFLENDGENNINQLLSNNPTINKKLQYLFPEIKTNLPIMVKCICPKFEQTYNKSIIRLSAATIILIGIIITVVSVMFLHTRGIYVFIIWVILLLVYLSLLIINPKCIFKTCLEKSEDWKPVEGYFKGTKTLLGVTIKLDINIKKDNTAILNVLTCDGNACPSKNMIDKCSNKNVNISKIKTRMGYSIVGSCIDQIKNIKTSDGSTIVKGLWMVRKKGYIKIQLFLHFVYGGIKIDKYLVVNLQKYSPTKETL